MTRGPLQSRWWLAGALAGVAAGLIDGLLAFAPGGGPGDDAENLLGVASSVLVWSIAGALAFALGAALLGARSRGGRGPLGTGQWLALLLAGASAAAGISCIGLRLAAALLGPAATPSERAAVSLFGTAILGIAAIRLLRPAALRRPGRVAGSVALGAGVLWLGLLGRDWTSASASTRPSDATAVSAVPPASAPNVLLVVLDTTRADHLSAYGYARPTTPFLAELARESTLYENAVSPAAWTLPSHASLFTGQLPSVHGATAEHRWLRDELETVAEALRARGYATAGFTNNAVVSHAYNFDQGFDQFADVFLEWGPEFGWTEGRRRTIPESLLHRFREWRKPPDKGAERTNQLVSQWLDGWQGSSPKRPFFLFVNLLEAHLPYTAPPPFRSRFAEPPIRPAIAGLHSDRWYHEAFKLMGTKGALNSDDYAQLAALYDEELAYQDERLRELVNDLRRRGVLDDTLLVVVSDHGENLGEHGGLLNHVLSFHQTLLHVPLLVRHPGRFPAGLRYAPPVSTASVYATILDETGTPHPASQTPAFGPLPRDAAAPAQADIISEYELPVFGLAAIVDDVPGLDIAPIAVRQKAVRQGPWKLVQSTPGGTSLYDLEKDPLEANPLPGESTAEGRAMESYLHRWEATLPANAVRSAGSHAVDEQTQKALEGLGYVR